MHIDTKGGSRPWLSFAITEKPTSFKSCLNNAAFLSSSLFNDSTLLFASDWKIKMVLIND